MLTEILDKRLASRRRSRFKCGVKRKMSSCPIRQEVDCLQVPSDIQKTIGIVK